MAKCDSFAFRFEWLSELDSMSGEEALAILRYIKDIHENKDPKLPEDRFLRYLLMSISGNISECDSINANKSRSISEAQKARWKKYREQKKKQTNGNKASIEYAAKYAPPTPPADEQQETQSKEDLIEQHTQHKSVPPVVQQEAPTQNNEEDNSKDSHSDDSVSPSFSEAKVGEIVIINGTRVIKRGNGKGFFIPSIEEIEAYIREKGYHFPARTLYDYYESSSPPWYQSNGKPVCNWKQCCATFESKYLTDQGRRTVSNTRVIPAHEDLKNKQYDDF